MNTQRDLKLETPHKVVLSDLRIKKKEHTSRHPMLGTVSLPSLQPKTTQHSSKKSKYRQYIIQSRLNKMGILNNEPLNSKESDEDDSMAKHYEDEEAEEKEELKQFEGEEFSMVLLGGKGFEKFHKFYKRQKRIEEIQAQYHKKPPAAQILLKEMEKNI